MSGISLHNKAIISIDTLGRIQLSLQEKKSSSHAKELEGTLKIQFIKQNCIYFIHFMYMPGKFYFGISTRLMKKIKEDISLISIFSFNNYFLNANFVEQATLQGIGKDQMPFLTFSREIRSLIVY